MDTRMNSDSPPLVGDSPALYLTSDIELTVDLDAQRAGNAPSIEASPRVSGIVEPLEDLPPHELAERELPLAPGRVLLDRYVLTQILGIGGTCIVFRARDLEAATREAAFVALKTPRPDLPDRSRAIERLKREFEHARGLSHIGIVQVFDLRCDGDIWFMTMELLEGQTLAALVRSHGGALPALLSRRILRSAAEALNYAHVAGIAHGDFNPANVFVVRGDKVKLLDFGTACSRQQEATAAATFAYASPQVLEGATPNVRDDIFSFACVAYEMVTGKHPFDYRSSTQARIEGLHAEAPTSLPTAQTLALMTGLSWDNEARPTDIRTFVQSIAPEPQRPLRPATALPDPSPSEPEMGDDRRWWILAGACAVAMIAAVVMTRFA